MLRFHTQTAGVSLQAQQIDNNVVRVTVQALAAILGGTQSLHTNAKDEALALPTAETAQLALRTQQVLAYESGVADVVDPLAGSYYVESLTDEIERRAWEYIQRIDERGGALAAVEAGYIQSEIQEAAYEYQRQVERGERIIVGTNRFQSSEAEPTTEILTVDPSVRQRQCERLRTLRAVETTNAVRSCSNDCKQPPAMNMRICFRSSSRRSKRTVRSARSPMPSAQYGARHATSDAFKRSNVYDWSSTSRLATRSIELSCREELSMPVQIRKLTY